MSEEKVSVNVQTKGVEESTQKIEKLTKAAQEAASQGDKLSKQYAKAAETLVKVGTEIQTTAKGLSTYKEGLDLVGKGFEGIGKSLDAIGKINSFQEGLEKAEGFLDVLGSLNPVLQAVTAAFKGLNAAVDAYKAWQKAKDEEYDRYTQNLTKLKDEAEQIKKLR